MCIIDIVRILFLDLRMVLYTFINKLWDKISLQYQGYLVGVFLFLLVTWLMWSVWDKTSY